MKINCKIEKDKRYNCVFETFIIDGEQFEVGDLINCLIGLEEDKTLKIQIKNIEDLLLKYKLAYKNHKGLWSQYSDNTKLKKFKEKLNKILIESRTNNRERRTQ